MLSETPEQSTERGWRMIRAHRTPPSDRACIPPHIGFMDGGLAAADVDEFLRGLDEWRAAPTANRFRAEVVAIRALAHSGYLDAIDEPLDRFTASSSSTATAHAAGSPRSTARWPERVAIGSSRSLVRQSRQGRRRPAAHLARPGGRVAPAHRPLSVSRGGGHHGRRAPRALGVLPQ